MSCMASITSGVVGSVNAQLETCYRFMLLDIAYKLSDEDCQKIAYVAGLPLPTYQHEPTKPCSRLHLINTLESLGHIGPLELQFLETTIVAIGKNYLLNIIRSYKKNPLYKEAVKRLDEQERRKNRGKKCKPPPTTAPDYPRGELHALTPSADRIHRLRRSYAALLTQFSQIALLMRTALESGDSAQIEQAFVSVASDGDAIARTLRRSLEEAGLKCSDEESSGAESQGKLC